VSAEPQAATLRQATKRDPTKLRQRFLTKLREPGLIVAYPSPLDSIIGDMGGWRSALADRDIGFEMRSASVVQSNVLEAGQPEHPQRYAGQRPTLSAALNATATFGLDSIGLENGLLSVGATAVLTSWDVNPQGVSFRAFYFYNSWLDKAVELKFGYIGNAYEYIGLFVGGSPVLTSGFSSVIPFQVGLSSDPAVTPAVNLTLRSKTGIYTRVGIQRSLSPRGLTYEMQTHGAGLNFTNAGAHALFIGELGLRRPSSASSRSLWLRAGGLYNKSNYPRFDGRGDDVNGCAFIAGDVQALQVSPNASYRGVFLGAAAFWAPPIVNVFTQNYELRAYSVGLFDARTSDSIAVKVNYSKFSDDARRALAPTNLGTHPDQLQVQGSYSLHVLPGIYVIGAASWITNPSFLGEFNDAVVMTGTLYTIF
jgi:porin